MLHPLGYADIQDFIRRGLDLNPSLVQWAVQGLQTSQPDAPIPFTHAIELRRQS
jgi:hypothetical protein